MQVMAKRSLRIVDGLAFSFPASRGCNCGVGDGMRVLEQDTRVTRYLFGGGSEIKCKFPIPFCCVCAPSAARRPPGLFGRLLVVLLSFAIAAAVLVGIGDFALHSTFIATYLFPVATLAGVLFTVFFNALRRPRVPQTSFNRPVRITKMGQEFVSGTVKKIRRAFANESYRTDFVRLNDAVIKRQLVEAVSI
ncbi:MAG: hypothetical protein WBV39_13760 [Rudaea sp.]